MKKRKPMRHLKRDFSDRWSRQETLEILDDTMTQPSETMDVPLIRECLLTLDPAYEGAYAARGEQVWSRISDAITPQKRSMWNNRRMLSIVLAGALLLALAAGAIATAVQRGVFNFIWDFGFDQSGAVVQDSAKELLHTNLASLHLEHVDVEVREAVYDGQDLRVVYAVIEKGRTEPFTEEDAYKPVIDAGWEDGLTCCDWIEINGQDAYFGDTYQAPGENPGEMLYYLHTTPSEWDVGEIGDEMTIGIPMRRRADGPGMEVPDELRFTISSAIPEGMLRKAERAEISYEHLTLVLEDATFSPISARLRVSVPGVKDDMEEPLVQNWSYTAQLFTPQGEQLGFTSVDYWGYQDENAVNIQYRSSPPKEWPEEMVLAVVDENGVPDLENGIPVRLEK